MSGMNACQDHAPRPHNEFICHATGEQRQNLLNKIKMLLDNIDDRPCLVPEPVKTAAYNRPLMKYPGYIDPHHPLLQPKPNPPLITSCGVQEVRPTTVTDPEAGNDPPYVVYKKVDMSPGGKCKPTDSPDNAPKGKSFQVKGGVVINVCECLKRNGLQDDCPLSDCMGKPECTTIPGPCCPPALSYYANTCKKDQTAPPPPAANGQIQPCKTGKPGVFVCCCCHKC